MKVLLLHQHFNIPQRGGAIRSYYLAKGLVDRGFDVTVISGSREKRTTCSEVDGITVYYLPVAYENRYGFYRRSFSFLRYIWGAVRVGSRFKNTRLCYAISVPLTVGIAAMILKRLYRIPFIFEVGDLWPDAPIQMGFVRSLLFQRLLYGLEKTIYRNATSLVGLSPAIVENLKSKIPGKPVHLIPNMADTKFYKPESKKDDLLKKFNAEQGLVVSYLGAVGVANGLEYFLHCASVCQHQRLPVRFLLCGEGAVLPAIQQLARELGLENLTLLPFRNRDGVREILEITDVDFICYRNVPILETGSPNKYFDGLAAGKLIVINFGGWIREEIEKAACGFFVHPQQPQEFAEKIRMFLNDKSLLQEYQRNARKLAEQHYSRERLTDRFVSVIEGEMEKRDSRPA